MAAMKSVMFYGVPIKPEEFELAEKLYREPPVFTEEQWDFDEPFTDPACKLVSVHSKIFSAWYLYACGSMHAVAATDEPLRFDALFLHKMNGGSMLDRRLRAFCKLTGLTFRVAAWRLALQLEL